MSDRISLVLRVDETRSHLACRAAGDLGASLQVFNPVF